MAAKKKPTPKTAEERDEENRAPLAALMKPLPVRMGRPTDYKPEYCFSVLAAGAEGKSKAVIASELGITLRTMYNWMMVHPDFFQAIEQAEVDAQAWWEEAGRKAMFMPGFNTAIWSRSMSARFPRDWRENKSVEVTGRNGGPLEIEGAIKTITIDNMSDRALEAIEEAVEIALITQEEGEDEGEA
jgi:transposase